MEGKMKGPIEDPKKAEVGAYAEKPFRDLTLAENSYINDEEKEALVDFGSNVVAERAMDDYEKNNIAAKPEVVKTPESINESKLFEALVNIIESNPNVKFLVYGAGDVLNKGYGARNEGQYSYSYDISKEGMEKFPGFSNSPVRAKTEEAERLPDYEKKVLHTEGDIFEYIGLQENTRGDENSGIYADDRGANFAAAIMIDLRIGYKENEREELGKLLALPKENPDELISLMEKLCLKYIPKYYQELERIKKMREDK